MSSRHLCCLFETIIRFCSYREANRKKMKMDNLQATTLTMLNPPVQPTLAQFNASRGEFSEDVVQRIDKAVMDLLIVDMLLSSTVEGKAFKRLNLCDPSAARRYNVKSEKFYRTTLLDQTFTKVSGQVRKCWRKLNGCHSRLTFGATPRHRSRFSVSCATLFTMPFNSK